MLNHDKYWNWSIKKGDMIISDVTENGLIKGEEYEVVVPQGTRDIG